jgi:hypothetical protein
MTYAFNSCSLENIVIPASVNNILERAFGDITSLKTVTFKKATDATGNIKVPAINRNAFVGSGSQEAPIVFNLPWSEQQHYSAFTGLDGDNLEKDPTFGANYYVFNFDYKETN